MMWYIFAVLSLTCYLLYDIMGKRIIDEGDGFSPLRLRIVILFFGLLLAAFLYVFGFCSDGFSLWNTIVSYPIIFLACTLAVLAELLYLASLKYISLSMQETVGSTNTMMLFLGYTIISLFANALPTVSKLFVPLRLIPICVVAVFTVLLPNAELLAKRKSDASAALQQKKRKDVAGIFIALAAIVLDVTETITVSYIFDTYDIDTVDYFITASAFFVPLIALGFLILKIKKQRFRFPRKKKRLSLLYCTLYYAASLAYLQASSLDAIMTGMIFCIYSALALIGARILLKERFTKRQGFCACMIVLGAIVFSFADILL